MNSPAATYVVWKEQFSVGNERLDAQHKRVFELLNTCYRVLQEGGSQRRLTELLEQVCRYAEEHFASEEAAMTACGYPRLREHQAMHQDYTLRVNELRWSAEQYQEDVAVELFSFLREWWLGHVTRADADYAPHLK